MRVQPFAFIKEPAAEGGGDVFPTLNGTLVDYWRADQGITLSGANVIEWEGQANATVLEDATLGPTVSGSNAGFNNVDTLTFNGSSQGMGKIFSNLGGTDTGNLYMSLYGAPHGDGGGWGAIHGLTGLPSPFNFVEGAQRVVSNTQTELWGYPPGGTTAASDDTLGKGIYTIAIGTSNPNGANYFNKSNNTVVATRGPYSSYQTTRQGYTIGCYNFQTGGSLHGKVDVAGIAIWTNPPDVATSYQDIASVETYFSNIFG